MRLFLTGASGCIGHYLAETLIQETEHELFLLVRNPDKLQFNDRARPGITVLPGDLRNIERWSELLKTVEVAILAATAWGGTAETFEINVTQTLRLLTLLELEVCQQVVYFSTASILNRDNQLLKPAQQFGIDYIRSKYKCFEEIAKLAIAPKVTAVFPTLVFGGDRNKPYSHISAGLPEVVRWIDLIRWFKADGSCHFIHARDIAQVVRYLIEHPAQIAEKNLVLGNPQLTVNEIVEQVCSYFNKRLYFRVPLSIGLANLLIKIFRIQMDEWSRFSLNYRHFTYKNPVGPATFGLVPYCTTVAELLKVSGISPK